MRAEPRRNIWTAWKKVRDGLEELEQLPERQYKKTLPVLFFLAAGITAAILLLAGGSGYLKRTAERAREQEYEKKGLSESDLDG